MTEEIKWLFFDLGSTLIDETECYRDRVMTMINGTDVTYDEFIDKMLFFYRQNGKGDRLAADYFGLAVPEWKSALERLYPDVKESLEKLRRRYRLGVIANQNPGTVGRLKKWGIDGFFDVIAASAELGVAKPDPAIFLAALNAAGCQPADAVMIGDRLDNDIAPAKALGMTTIRVLQGYGQYRVPACNGEIPDYTVRSVSELCGIFI